MNYTNSKSSSAGMEETHQNTPNHSKHNWPAANPIAQHEQGTDSARKEVRPNENGKEELDPNNPKAKQINTKENQSLQTNKVDK